MSMSTNAFLMRLYVCCLLELKEAVQDILPSLREQAVCVYLMVNECDLAGVQSLSDKVEKASDSAIPQSLRSDITFKSPAVYIYTSGTTGMGVREEVHPVLSLSSTPHSYPLSLSPSVCLFSPLSLPVSLCLSISLCFCRPP